MVAGDVFTDPIHTVAYSTDAGIYQIIPQCVVCPANAEDVAVIVKFAKSQNIPIAPRGAASGLAGESLCAGIVLDMSRYMSRLISIDNEAEFVTCQPGLVLDELNEHLRKFGRKIGPDPSSGNRATIGGCIANNATGAHSPAYGYMADHLHSVQAVLADGSKVRLTNNMSPEDIDNDFLESAARQIISLLSENEKTIADALPKTSRNRSGYNIADVCHNGRLDLARLLCGCEGTLAIFTEITLRTVAIPPFSAQLQLEFDSYGNMAGAVPLLIENNAAACELMDNSLISLASASMPQYRDILPADALTVLWAEFNAENEDALHNALQQAAKATASLAVKSKSIFDHAVQQRISKARKDAVPLLYRKSGTARPVPFIEDVSVENINLDKYIAGLEQIRRRYNIEMAYYGHAGDGELHIRPYLDLSQPSDVQKMLDIANDVFTLAWSLGGSISGEHADGLVRAAFIRRQYGDQFYELLRKTKQILDPNNLLNPGKIINDDPEIMTKNLRDAYTVNADRLSSDAFSSDDELKEELRKCNGCGLCLSDVNDLRMCPVHHALKDELSASRAKSNLIRAWAAGQIDEKTFHSRQFKKILDLCVNCKACSLECPSGVDVSKLVVAARTRYRQKKMPTLAEFLLSRNRYLSILMSKIPLAERISRWKASSLAMDKIIGLDKRRQLPAFDKGSFTKAGRKYLHSLPTLTDPADKVAYFVDTFANYNDHEIGFKVIDILHHNNIDVVIPDQRPVPMPAMVYGNSKTATRDLKYNLKSLLKAIADGCKIICSEPSAALALKTELQDYIRTDEAALIAENTFEFVSYLNILRTAGKLKPAVQNPAGKFLYHPPCHSLAISDGNCPTVELLRQLADLEIESLGAGCCGLAGTFGMQKKNYDLSMKIAQPLKKALADSDAEYVITECAACGMQIEHISEKTAIHTAKVIARCFGL